MLMIGIILSAFVWGLLILVIGPNVFRDPGALFHLHPAKKDRVPLRPRAPRHGVPLANKSKKFFSFSGIAALRRYSFFWSFPKNNLLSTCRIEKKTKKKPPYIWFSQTRRTFFDL